MKNRLVSSWRALCAATALVALLVALSFVGTADARYPKPGCGDSREGTLDLASESCPPPATNCTEITVCG